MSKLLSMLLFAYAAIAQTPTEYNFLVGTNTGGGGGNQAAQMQTIRSSLVGVPISIPKLCAHNIFLGAGLTINNATPITLGATNSYTDSLVQSGVSCIEANVDMDLFIPNTVQSAFITNYDSAWQHVVSDGVSNIRFNMTINAGTNGAGSTSSQFTKDACTAGKGGVTTCDTTTTPCSVANPCFDTFAHWQAYYLGNSGPVVTLLTRWGGTIAGEGLSTNLKSTSAAHELLTLTCTGLNPNWTVSSQCTAANWQAFGNAFVTLVRGLSAGTCTNCPTSASTPMNLSIAFIAGPDAAMYNPSSCTTNCVCGVASTLSSCFLDLYVDPTNTPSGFLAGTVTTFYTNVLCCGGTWGIEETVMPNWVAGNSPQSETNSYRGGVNNDWGRYHVWQDWLRTWVLKLGSFGASQMGVFNAYPIISYAQQPSCPNGFVPPAACGTPNLACGTNGNQCFGDVATANPLIPNFANELTAHGTLMTQAGLDWLRIATSGLTSSAF